MGNNSSKIKQGKTYGKYITFENRIVEITGISLPSTKKANR